MASCFQAYTKGIGDTLKMGFIIEMLRRIEKVTENELEYVMDAGTD